MSRPISYINGASHRNDRRSLIRIALSHIFCWCLFILFELSLFSYSGGVLEPAWHYLVFYSVNISFFYLLLIGFRSTSFDTPKDWLLTVLSTVVVIVLYLAVKALANYIVDGSAFSMTDNRIIHFIATNVFRGGYFLLLAVFYRTAGHIADHKRRAAEATNAYLRQQMNPHMIFNTLNFIYSKVEEPVPEAGRCLVILSDILRFGLESDGLASLREEFRQVAHLTQLNQYRFDGKLYLEVAVQGETDDKWVLPLIILTLVENVFKHGDLSRPEQPAKINIFIDTNELYFQSRNLKRPTATRHRKRSIGLENIRLRLLHTYGEHNFDLTTRDEKDEFIVDLRMPLHHSADNNSYISV